MGRGKSVECDCFIHKVTKLKIKPYFYLFLFKAINKLLTVHSRGGKTHISIK